MSKTTSNQACANVLKKFRLIELECESLIKAIDLHKQGMESKTEVLIRLKVIADVLNKTYEELKYG